MISRIRFSDTGLGLSNAGTAAGFGHADVILPLAIGVALVAGFTRYANRRARQPLVGTSSCSVTVPLASASAVLFFSGFSLVAARRRYWPRYHQEDAARAR